jgi:hypothetical protein
MLDVTHSFNTLFKLYKNSNRQAPIELFILAILFQNSYIYFHFQLKRNNNRQVKFLLLNLTSDTADSYANTWIGLMCSLSMLYMMVTDSQYNCSVFKSHLGTLAPFFLLNNFITAFCHYSAFLKCVSGGNEYRDKSYIFHSKNV